MVDVVLGPLPDSGFARVFCMFGLR